MQCSRVSRDCEIMRDAFSSHWFSAAQRFCAGREDALCFQAREPAVDVREHEVVICDADKPAAVDVVKNAVVAGPFRISCEDDDGGVDEAVVIDITREYVERVRERRDRGIARVRLLPGSRKTDIDWSGCHRIVITCEAEATRSPGAGGGEEAARAARPL